MSMRVATFNASARMLETTLGTQARMNELRIQQATGKISTDYGGLGSSAGRLINVEVSKARAEAFAKAASLSADRVEVMYDACGAIVDVLTELRAKISQASSSLDSVGGKAINAVAAELMKEAAALMNTEFEGRYLFAGSRVDTRPVDLTALAPQATAPTSSDTSYYRGDAAVTSVRVSNDDVIEYGITAADPAFEKTLRVFNLVANMSVVPLDTAAMDEASSLVLDALDAMTNAQTMLSLDARALERAEQNQLDYVDYAETMAKNLGEVDIAAVAASLSTYEAQLQASYSAIAKIQSLRLVDYLR